MDVDRTERVVVVDRELVLDVTKRAFEVTRSANNGKLALGREIGVRTFKGELTGASIEIFVGTLALPNITLVEASAEFKVASNLVTANLVVHGTREGPRLTSLNRSIFQLLNDGSVCLNDGIGPFLYGPQSNNGHVLDVHFRAGFVGSCFPP